MITDEFEKQLRASAGARHPVITYTPMAVMETSGSGNLFDI